MVLVRSSVVLVLFACFFFSSYNNIGIEGGSRFISKEEDIELEKQLKLLNKPAIKSIQTKHGDLYDCVDFYKQPAFDHPLLKNHTFHPRMRPSSVPKLMRKKELSKAKSSSKVSYNSVSCPRGTVPIRRVTKDDLIREKLYSERYGSKYSVLTTENPGTHYAVVQTHSSDPKKKYNGGGAHIGIYNPFVTGTQYSSSRMKIQNGLESIQIGWMVNPTLYGNNSTRQYIFYSNGQSRCFNARCPGFVIVDANIPVDVALPYSESGGDKFALQTLVYKDKPVGNWWLELGDKNTKVGFWPARLFTSLADSATSVQWGGEVFSPTDIPSPPMGTGKFPDPYSGYVAYCETITTVNEANQIADAYNIEVYKDIDRYDTLAVNHDKGKWVRQAMVYGGPGGATGN